MIALLHLIIPPPCLVKLHGFHLISPVCSICSQTRTSKTNRVAPELPDANVTKVLPHCVYCSFQLSTLNTPRVRLDPQVQLISWSAPDDKKCSKIYNCAFPVLMKYLHNLFYWLLIGDLIDLHIHQQPIIHEHQGVGSTLLPRLGVSVDITHHSP